MKRVLYLMIPVIFLLMLTSCSRTPAVVEGVRTADSGDTRLLIVRLEGERVKEASVRVFSAEQGEENALITKDEWIPVFDGIDTYLLTLPSGGDYMMEIISAQGHTSRYFICMKKERVYSFLINPDEKPEIPVRELWPQTPHSRPEPH